jgi:hypothetical protein
MIQIPADLGQRILDAARIAAAMHEQQLGVARSEWDAPSCAARLSSPKSGGAGRNAVIDHDGHATSMDGSPAPRLRRWWSRLR